MRKANGPNTGLHDVREVPKFLQQFAPMLEKKEPEKKRGKEEKFNPEEEAEFHRQAIAQALGDAGVSGETQTDLTNKLSEKAVEAANEEEAKPVTVTGRVGPDGQFIPKFNIPSKGPLTMKKRGLDSKEQGARKRQAAAHYSVVDTSKGYGGPREATEESSASKRFKDVGPEAEYQRMLQESSNKEKGDREEKSKKKHKKKKKRKEKSEPIGVLSFDPEED